MNEHDALRARAAQCAGWTIHQIDESGLADVAILPPGVSIDDDGAVFKYAGIDLPPLTLDWLHDLARALPIERQENFAITLYRLVIPENNYFPENQQLFIFATAPVEKWAEAYVATMTSK